MNCSKLDNVADPLVSFTKKLRTIIGRKHTELFLL